MIVPVPLNQVDPVVGDNHMLEREYTSGRISILIVSNVVRLPWQAGRMWVQIYLAT